MNTYLARFESRKTPGKYAYKVGHTKWPDARKRFADDQYDAFNIEILNSIIINHSDPVIARNYCKLVEECFKAIYPKNFRLEQYFDYPEGTFDGLSGITEMFILEEDQMEERITSDFEQMKKASWKALK